MWKKGKDVDNSCVVFSSVDEHSTLKIRAKHFARRTAGDWRPCSPHVIALRCRMLDIYVHYLTRLESRLDSTNTSARLCVDLLSIFISYHSY